MREPGAIFNFAACCLTLAGAFLALAAMSDAPAGEKLPWKARFVATHKRHPRAHSLSFTCLSMALICVIASVHQT